VRTDKIEVLIISYPSDHRDFVVIQQQSSQNYINNKKRKIRLQLVLTQKAHMESAPACRNSPIEPLFLENS